MTGPNFLIIAAGFASVRTGLFGTTVMPFFTLGGLVALMRLWH